MNHGEYLGLEFDDLDAPPTTLDPVGGERTIRNQGTSLHVQEQDDIPAPVTGSSGARLSG